MDKETIRLKIAEIVAKYQSQSASAIKSTNEAATKQGYIAPLFTALGWNFDDTEEVSPEEAASSGRVDYAFKLMGVSQFYLEAKKFNVDLNNPDFIKQAVTYAHNKGVTWAILTNFEFIRVYNANTGKLFLNLENSKYATDNFDRLWLLSKDSLQNGTLNEEAETYGALPPSTSIEQKLFKQLRGWREILINELLGYNENLKPEQADEVIQRLFNRLIFIRTAEDRHIEDNHLKAAVHQWEANHHKKDQLLNRLRGIFEYFNGYYDSELFAFHLTDSVFITEPTIQEILIGLYEIPGGLASYDFSIIDVDVLGAVYEQYLGYVADIVQRRAQEEQARLSLGFTSDSHYQVTAKKQHRKEQGIYYTPKYVTDYIIKETLGRYLKEHSFNENRHVKILDPSCGSGSFLIRAFDELLNYHAKEHNKSATELQQYERLRILTENIHGVDLDIQAVEIARLNMLLRSLAKRELLPGLKENIKQGNSLVAGTEEELEGYFGVGWKDKKPFNWDEEFKDVLKAGGFDIIVGNPPYGMIFDEAERKYIAGKYTNSRDNKNAAMVFIEKALSLLKPGGYFAFIIPKSLAYSQAWASGRKLVLDRLGVAADTNKAFKEVLLEQMVIVVSKRFTPEKEYQSYNLTITGKDKQSCISKDLAKLSDNILMGIDQQELEIFHKMTGAQVFMKDISKTSRGLPYQKYLARKGGVPIYRGEHIGRYILKPSEEMLPEVLLKESNTKLTFLRKPKIMSQQILAHVTTPFSRLILMSTLDPTGMVLTLDTIQNTIITDNRYSHHAVLGLLNSRLWSWYAHRFIYSNAIRTMHFDSYYLNKFPLPSPTISHSFLVVAVEKIINLNDRFAVIREIYSQEREELINEINRTEKEIDNIIYELYGLSPVDISIIEGKTK